MSSQHAIHSYDLASLMRSEGIDVPDGCREVRVIAPFDGAVVVQYEVFLSVDDTARFGRALEKLASGQQEPTGRA